MMMVVMVIQPMMAVMMAIMVMVLIAIDGGDYFAKIAIVRVECCRWSW